MVYRSFSRSFHQVVDASDCDCTGKLSARMIADKQPGKWDVWFYTPPSNPSADGTPEDEMDSPFEIFGRSRQEMLMDCENHGYLVAAASTV